VKLVIGRLPYKVNVLITLLETFSTHKVKLFTHLTNHFIPGDGSSFSWDYLNDPVISLRTGGILFLHIIYTFIVRIVHILFFLWKKETHFLENKTPRKQYGYFKY
ncbi:hypothetical protein Anas_03842, partial [Armadillidium nasatum]